MVLEQSYPLRDTDFIRVSTSSFVVVIGIEFVLVGIAKCGAKT